MATAKKNDKAPNYTTEQTASLVNAYTAASDEAARRGVVEKFAEEFGKGTRSIIAKLTREGVYKKASYVRKDGEAVQKKDETADAIGAVLKLSEADTDSLTKCNRKALQEIWKALANSKPIDGDAE